MITTKFQLGQMVERNFTSEIEGIPVTVTKRLWIQSITIQVRADWGPYAVGQKWNVIYGLCENDPIERSNVGRKYISKDGVDLREVEPVIEVIEQAQPIATTLDDYLARGLPKDSALAR